MRPPCGRPVIEVSWLLRAPAFHRAVARVDTGSLRIEWAQDSAFRFYPLSKDDRFGYRLHDADAAVNKPGAGRAKLRSATSSMCSISGQPVAGSLGAGPAAARTTGCYPGLPAGADLAAMRPIPRGISTGWRSGNRSTSASSNDIGWRRSNEREASWRNFRPARSAASTSTPRDARPLRIRRRMDSGRSLATGAPCAAPGPRCRSPAARPRLTVRRHPPEAGESIRRPNSAPDPGGKLGAMGPRRNSLRTWGGRPGADDRSLRSG